VGRDGVSARERDRIDPAHVVDDHVDEVEAERVCLSTCSRQQEFDMELNSV
jgi:hypothetical protein